MEGKEIYQQLGSIDALKYMKVTAEAANVMLFQQIKESKSYKLIGYNSWADFCETELKMSYKTADEAINNLKALGADFYDAAQRMGITTRHMRQLRAIPEELSIDATAGTIKVGDAEIPLTPAASEELQEAITDLLSEKESKIDKLNKTVESKEKLIEKGHEYTQRVLADKKELEKKLNPTLEDSEKAMNAMQKQMDVMFKQLDPEEPLLDLSTDRAQAQYGALVTWLYTSATALYQHAADTMNLNANGYQFPKDGE